MSCDPSRCLLQCWPCGMIRQPHDTSPSATPLYVGQCKYFCQHEKRPSLCHALPATQIFGMLSPLHGSNLLLSQSTGGLWWHSWCLHSMDRGQSSTSRYQGWLRKKGFEHFDLTCLLWENVKNVSKVSWLNALFNLHLFFFFWSSSNMLCKVSEDNDYIFYSHHSYQDLYSKCLLKYLFSKQSCQTKKYWRWFSAQIVCLC